MDKSKQRRDEDENSCAFEGCGRRRYARELCQSHHRQKREGRELQPIRPYRRRSPDTRKFAGLRLTPHCIEQLRREGEREGLSQGATISRVLEAWFRRKRPPPRGR